MWHIEAPQGQIDQFRNFQIHEVLYDFDGPRIFTTLSGSLLRLWYECAEDHVTCALRYLVVPADLRAIEKLKSGARTVHDVLSQPWIWAVDVNIAREPESCWVLASLQEVPAASKPEVHTPLWPELAPLIAYRLIGPQLHEGNVSASVAAKAMERPISALKRLLEYVNDVAAQGRPEDEFRRHYDLKTQRIAFNSFEVAFSKPSPLQMNFEEGNDPYARSSTELQLALSWLNDPEAHRVPNLPLLEVIKDLSPPAHGEVVTAEIRGQLLPNYPVVRLNQQHRAFIQRTIRETRGENRVDRFEGRVGAFDRDGLSIMLRDIAGGVPELKCTFSEEHFDDLYAAFDEQQSIVLLGRMSPTRRVLEVVAVEQGRLGLGLSAATLPQTFLPNEDPPTQG